MKMKGKNTAFAERYRVYVTSHTGLLRGNNEDNFTVNSVSKKLEYKNVSFSAVYEAPLLAAVFDGMGGESLGEYASCISARMFRSKSILTIWPSRCPLTTARAKLCPSQWASS